ncbi:hypothetical protein [Flavobacterium sp.]|jgi:hypothetical protein|uniref:hypothetical protein n=1 Tax=Flavobacterium sp. TaxID=239 RepID=UPI0037BFE499
MENIQEISFRLRDIEILQTNITLINEILKPDTIFKFNINIEHLVNVVDDIIAVKPLVEIFTEESDEIIASLTASFIFEFEKLKDFVSENEIKLPSDIIISINSISISTLRGIMFSTFKGTQLHNAILPIIDPKSFRTK